MNNENKAPVRQIMFRGLRVDGKGLVYGSLINNCFVDAKTKYPALYIFNPEECDNADCWEDYTDGYGYYEVIPESVGQFTGKLTKSGTRIYDGDKLQQSRDCYWVVKWSDSKSGWNCYQYVYSKDGDGDGDGEYSWKKSNTYPLGHSLNGLITYNYEVIGNIHEESEVTNG